MFSDELFKAAVIRFHDMELDALPSNQYLEERQEVSPDFYRRIMKLINSSRRWATVRKITRRVAMFFLTVVLSFLLLCGINEDLRAKCLQFWREMVSGGMTDYHSPAQTAAPDESTVIGLKLGYVPEGFELDEADSDVGSNPENGTQYYFKDDVLLSLDYSTATNTNMSVDNEHSKLEKITLKDGSECDFYRCNTKGYANILVWRKYRYIVSVTMDSQLADSEVPELMKVVENVEVIRK